MVKGWRAMAQIRPDKLAELRRRYTKGSRVKLIHMNDPYRPDLREGALGTVTAVRRHWHDTTRYLRVLAGRGLWRRFLYCDGIEGADR